MLIRTYIISASVLKIVVIIRFLSHFFSIIYPSVGKVNTLRKIYFQRIDFHHFLQIQMMSEVFPATIPSINCLAARAERVPRFKANFSAAASSFESS